MATALFAWELGLGYGHMLPYRDLVERLIKRDFRVFFASRNLGNARRVFGAGPVTLLQAPSIYETFDSPRLPGGTYCDVLRNAGFADVEQVAARIQAWRFLLESVRPDLLVFDAAPAAMLASRDLDCARIASGTGFFEPPSVTPLPSARSWEPVPEAQLLEDEREVLDILNTALEVNGLEPLGSVGELLDCDERFVLNFPELSFYGVRDGEEYLGTFPSKGYGESYDWPDLTGKRVFGYLAPFKTLPSVFEAMRKLNVSATLYCPRINKRLKDRFHSERLRFVDHPADMERIALHCDAAVTNGNLSSTAGLMLAGVPVLVLPTTLEREVVGYRVQELGAGLSAPMLTQGGMARKLYAILSDRRYGDRAREFAERHSAQDRTWQLERMEARVGRLLGAPK